MVHAILIEHTVGIVHPAVGGCMVISWAELLTIGRVEGVALLHILPAEEVLHGTSKSAITIERNIEQQFFLAETVDVQGYIVVHLIYCEAHVQRLHLLTVSQYADVSIVLTLLNGQ